MATKKQKREAAEKKRAKFLAKVKADGLKAQAASHRQQEERTALIQTEADVINQRHRKILKANGINPDTGLPVLKYRDPVSQAMVLHEALQAGGFYDQDPGCARLSDYDDVATSTAVFRTHDLMVEGELYT